MQARRATIIALLIASLGAGGARADELSRLLEKGPMARVEFDPRGRFDAVLTIVDVDAPPEDLWRALTAFESYRFFMPRVSSVTERPAPAGARYVDWSIDTPLVATKYTNLATVDHGAMVLTAKTIEGDMSGSRYEWRVIKLGNSRCRMMHSAWPRNYAAIVGTLDDDQQTLMIGVAVGSVLATTRALKARAEQLAKQRPMTPQPTISATP